MTDWEKAKARLGEFLRVRGGTIPAQAEADIRSALEEVEDARSYAAEIAQGVSHYPHEEAEPCVRCRAERAEAEVARLRKWIKWCADIHEPCSAPGDFCLHCDAHAALRLRFGLEGHDEHTFEQIGAEFNVSKERARQLVSSGLRMLA